MAIKNFITILIKGDNKDFKRKLGDSEKEAKASGSRLQSLLFTAAKGAAIGGALAIFKDVATDLDNAAKSGAKLNAILKSTGFAAGITAGQLRIMRDELSVPLGGLFEGEQLLEAQAKLLTFTNISQDVFKRTLVAASDLSAVFEQDLKSSIIQLGKALNDPIRGITALSDIGVTFTESQRDTIKALVEANDLLGAQSVILKELERETGGAAEALAGAGTNSLVWAYREVKKALGTVVGGIGAGVGQLGSSAQQTFLDPLGVDIAPGGRGRAALPDPAGNRQNRFYQRRAYVLEQRLREAVARNEAFAADPNNRPIGLPPGPRSNLSFRDSSRQNIDSFGFGTLGALALVGGLSSQIDKLGGGAISQPGLGFGLFGQALASASLASGAIETSSLRETGLETRPGLETLTDSFTRIQNAALQDRDKIAKEQLKEQQETTAAIKSVGRDTANELAGFLGWQ